MRTVSRLAAGALVLGGALTVATPASAQAACPYPFDPADPRCLEVDDTTRDRTPAQPASRAQSPTTLPFTGGELTALSLAGAGALAGGITLVVAGRKRKVA